MSERDRQALEDIVVLANLLGLSLREEYLAETAACWRMMATHRAIVDAADLGPQAEPAALFKP